MFCKHDWKVISEQVVVSEGIKHQETYHGTAVQVSKESFPYHKEKHIVILQCKTCGKIKDIENGYY